MLETFDVQKATHVDEASLGWPDNEQLGEDSGLGCNRSFYYLGQPDWSDCRDLIAWEEKFIRDLESGNVQDVIEGDAREIEIAEMLGGLDPGVASAVFCLAASGAVPFSSCNGGAFGNVHQEHYPIISFYCRSYHVPFLLGAAEASSVALEQQANYIVAYTGDIRDFVKLARELYEMRDEIDRAGAIAASGFYQVRKGVRQERLRKNILRKAIERNGAPDGSGSAVNMKTTARRASNRQGTLGAEVFA